VRRVKAALAIRKVGHCGTLDPMAEGLLLVVFGKATKLQETCMSLRKTYVARLRLGIVTDTGDITGTFFQPRRSGFCPGKTPCAPCSTFLWAKSNRPSPVFRAQSAGRRMYELAREGRDFTPKPSGSSFTRYTCLP